MNLVGALSAFATLFHGWGVTVPVTLSKGEGLAGIIILFLTGLTFKVLLKDTSGQERLANYWERAAKEKDVRISELEDEVERLRDENFKLRHPR